MDRYNEYDMLLDEIYGEIKLGYMVFMPSVIIKNLDPIAYEQGYFDYITGVEE